MLNKTICLIVYEKFENKDCHGYVVRVEQFPTDPLQSALNKCSEDRNCGGVFQKIEDNDETKDSKFYGFCSKSAKVTDDEVRSVLYLKGKYPTNNL